MTQIYPAWLAQVPVLLFVFAFGACVGSFINVLAYRLPRGEDVVVPASRCPSCGTKLTWRENLPIIGWLLLRGKCRFCKNPISPEYPIVETIVAGLFAALYALWFMQPSPFVFLGVDAQAARPEWALAGLARMWPYFFFGILPLVGGLVAMTIIDAKTFTIPLVIPWTVGAVGLVMHPLHALWFERTGGSLHLSEHAWTIPTGGWAFTVACVGGLAGLAVAGVLLRFGVLPQSFADYEEWEKSVTPAEAAAPETAPPDDGAASREGSLLARVLLFTGPAIAGMFLGAAIGMRIGRWVEGMALGAAIGLLIGTFLRRLSPEDAPGDDDPVWTQYPHVRREMAKEALFLLFPIAGCLAGWAFSRGAVGTPPLWMLALGGSAAGVLIGGGVVWVVRVVFSLAFGKEAMGLGDVHMMAGVGAVLGWIDPTIAFFVAPFSGIAFALVAPLLGRVLKAPKVLPYGPHLAAATMLIVLAKPLVEKVLALIARTPINLP